MSKSKGTEILPGVEVPGHDEELTGLAAGLVSAKEETKQKREEEKRAAAELLEAMRERKLKRYFDADANLRVVVEEAHAKVKVLRKVERKVRRRRAG